MKKSTTKSTAQSDNNIVLQNNIEQLKQIIEKLSESNVSIEYGIEAFGQGIELARESLTILDTYKGTLKQLKQEADQLIETDLNI